MSAPTRKNYSLNELATHPEWIEEWAEAGRPFKAESMSGQEGVTSNGLGRIGWLDEEWSELYRQQGANGSILYTIQSFYTPIAWRTKRGWILASQSFSQRTSRHQGICRGLRPRVSGDLWCSGSGKTVEPVAREQRQGSRGNEGVCPDCSTQLDAPRGVLVHHIPGPKAKALR